MNKGSRKAHLAVYSQKVRKLTKQNAKKYCDDISTPHDSGFLDTDEEFQEFIGKDVLKKELDHKMPIVLCYDIGLPIEIAASPPNLQYIRCKSNREKSRNSNINILELIKQYKEWRQKIIKK